jgi:hypothetical protein
MAFGPREPRPGEKSADPPAPPPEAERSEAFTWFGSLGFPDVKGRPFVRVATGRWYQAGDDTPRNTYVRGFLVEENGDRFTVVTLSLTTETFQGTPAEEVSYKRVGYEASDLATGAAAYLEALRTPPKDGEGDSRPLWGINFHPRTEAFVLAWACWRAGLDKLAAGLFDHAAKMPTGYGYMPNDPPTQPLRRLVADDLAHTEMWRAVVAFGDPAVSRAQLLERFERITKNYPNSEHRKRARETALVLRRMIKEGAAHAAKQPAGPFERLGKEEQIAELIFQLRDQNGHQYTQPGACDIFDTLNDKKDTPAHRLIDWGYDAVPQLIDALEDHRFTRSVGFHRDFYFSHYVLRVGDCALDILERIAERTFWQSTSTFSYMTLDNQTAGTKEKVQAWYAELQKKGEKRLLIEATERGDRASYRQAWRLLERYPDAALPALLKGIEASKDDSTRALLVGTAADIKDESPLPLLLREVKEGPFAYGRLVAARSLHRRGRPEGVAAMIAEWQGQRPGGRPQSGEGPRQAEGPETGLVSVAEFLANCGQVEAIKALGKDLRKRPVRLRMAVVSSFGSSRTLSVLSTGGPGSLNPGGGDARDNPKAVRAAVTDLLIAALDDTDEEVGVSGTWDGKRFTDPRICDVAGHVLNQLEPEAYPFDLSAPLPRRNRGIVELKNVCRKAQGLAPLPLPAPRVIQAVPVEKLRPLVDELLRTPSDRRSEVEARIEELGLGALPGVLERLGKAGREDPARAALERLARRLAWIVDEVVVAEGSVKPDAALAAKLEAMKGKPFDPDPFLALVRLPVKNLPVSARGLRFSVYRGGDGTGATVKVNLLDEAHAQELGRVGRITRDPKAPRDVPSSWSFSESVEVGGKGLLGDFGVSGHPDLTNLREALLKACEAAPNEPIEVRLQLIPDLDP